jgi:general secretion pathway protein K
MRSRGSILVIVLILIGLISVLAAIVAETQRASMRASFDFSDDMLAQSAMRSAVELAVAKAGTAIQAMRDPVVVKLGKAEVTMVVRDETSRVDINLAPAALIAGLFRAVGIENEAATGYAARIVDWRDTDDQVSEGGAERSAYRAAGRIDGPRNGPLQHVAELALVLGLPASAVEAVAPHVTVASGRDKVNPLLADSTVLVALPGMSAERVRDFELARRRGGHSFRDLTAILDAPPGLLTEDTGYAVRCTGIVRLGPDNRRRYEAVVAVIEGDSEPYRILSWDANLPSPSGRPQ